MGAALISMLAGCGNDVAGESAGASSRHVTTDAGKNTASATAVKSATPSRPLTSPTATATVAPTGTASVAPTATASVPPVGAAGGAAPIGNHGSKKAAVSAAQTVQVGSSPVTVRVTGATAVTTKGNGPGTINGPGRLVSVSVANGSSRPVSLPIFTVTMFTGATQVPAQIVTTDSRTTTTPVTVASHATVTVHYVFAVRVPGDMSISVLVDPSSPNLVFSTVKN